MGGAGHGCFEVATYSACALAFILLVLIGIELLETIRNCLLEHVMNAQVVTKVAIIAIARKIIILDVNEPASLTLVGIAAIVLALAAGHLVIKYRYGSPARGEI
jgi:uncharacterized membrane protein (DUF373 family)